jgi:hypothetical protein
MWFSERHGYNKMLPEMLKEFLPVSVRNRLWNIFSEKIFYLIKNPFVFDSIFLNHTKTFNPHTIDFLKCCWDKFLKFSIDEFSTYNILKLKELFKKLFIKHWEWYRIYDFIEFFAKYYPDKEIKSYVLEQINTVLEEEKVPYRIIHGIVTPLFQKEEIKEIERVFDLPEKYKPVMEHLEKALRLYADRKKPDYENSIKESISAAESLAQIVLGKEGTLGDLVKSFNIHPALKKALSYLYGWTSDEEGIRHAKTGEPLSAGPEEARFMLVTASAFINYVVGKYKKSRQ